MPGCAVAECKNYNKCTQGTNIKYFSFPKSDDYAKRWIITCRREDQINLKHATICSIHFEETDFEIPLKQRLLNYFPKSARYLKADAVPALNLPGVSSDRDTAQKRKSEDRTLRIAKRRRREEVENILKASASTSSCTAEAYNMEIITEESELLTCDEQLISTLPNTERDQAELVELRQKVLKLESQNEHLLKEIKESKSTIAQKYNTLLAKVFTPGQIKMLLNPNKRVRWSSEDIASAISLRSVSPKAYRYLRANNYPLPAMSTLRSLLAYAEKQNERNNL